MGEIRRAISVGALLPQDALPSVRQLATELRVNPHTVAQAYRELEREGLVTVRRGHGTFVAAQSTGEGVRQPLVQEVAERALLDAHRHGIDIDDFIEAIHQMRESHGVTKHE